MKPYVVTMTLIVAVLLGIVMLGVLGVLGAGMIGVATAQDPRRSNRLMRARVILQGVALALMALLLLLRQR
jgi:hypothetical protein